MPRCADPPLATRRRAPLLCLWLAVAIGSAAAAPPADDEVPSTVPRLDERAALRAGQAAIGRKVPDYTLLDRQGRPVPLSSYRGKPLLVSFIYTGCFQVCPTNTRTLYEAVKGLERMLTPNQFNVVSIGFNQPFDSPSAMRAFAAQQRIDFANWEFLSPQASAVEPLTRDFGFSYVATPAGFDHVLGVTVLDAEGRVYTQVWGDRLTVDKLGEPLRQLLRQAPLPAQLGLADVIERVRILCTVYDPDTGQYRTNYAMLFEIGGGLAFFLSVGWYFLLEWRNRRRARVLVAAAAVATGQPLR
jgi:protein SCO1/2